MSRARKSRPAERGGLLRLVISVAVIAWVLRSFLFAPFSIPSGSMLPTLHIGDYLFVAKWPYGYSRYSFPLGFPSFDGRIFSDQPQRGDVVVFRHPDENEDLIKRVIGLPGDTVALRGGRVILNGKRLPRGDMQPVAIPISPNSPCRLVRGAAPMIRGSGHDRTCVYPTYRETLPSGRSYRVIDQVNNAIADNLAPVTVPPGHVFLMGDNRDDSLDSRYSIAEGGIGPVPVDHLVGRATILFWSTDGTASYVKPWTWFTALRTERIGNGFVTEAR
ncbi:MAG TPA: signal peptidase I [Sphingomicrobium sp.]|jgi:signal peptidase I|nr:signal peptidase I [Sphingomicrobium sp.]